MKNIIKTFENVLKENVKSIYYYDGGISNNNYIINGEYIYREKKSFSQPFYSSLVEKEIEEFIKDKNITVPLIHINEEGVKITKFIKDAKDLSNITLNDNLLIKIAKKIKELHSYEYVCSKDFSPLERLDYYLESNPNPTRELNSIIINKIKKYYDNTKLIMCHNDLVPGNFLIKDDEVLIIDFEYASNNHPFFDVISFLSENNITDKKKIDLFINAYYDNNPPSNIEEMIEDFYDFSDLLWYNWSVMMYMNLQEPIYHMIAKIKADRLIHKYAIHE